MNSFVRHTVMAIMAVFYFSAGVADAVLTSVGPTSAQTNFPLFYSDGNGLALELCLTGPDAGPPCFYDPVIADNPLSVSTGFGGEGFWFLSDSLIDDPSVTGLLVMGVEAAYGTGDPAPGQQISFARVRIRIDAINGTPGGTYTVTYPYGTKVYSDVPACTDATGCPNIINDTADIGVGAAGVFTGVLSGQIGPFLTMDPTDVNYAAITAAWPGFIGDSATPVKVIGSPFGTNYFRIQGPGGIDVQQDLFTLIGKLFTGSIPTPLVVESAAYARSALAGNPGEITVFATSAAFAAVTLSGAGIPTTLLSGDGNGNFFAHIPLANASSLPATITVTADNSATVPANQPTVLVGPLTDAVTITKAEYNIGTGNLTINAISSDAALPPVLTATGLGNLAGGTLVVNTIHPPHAVEVRSSAGGSDARLVDIVVLPFFSFSTPSPESFVVTFTDLSTNSPVSWLWDFGDLTGDTVQNPVHTFGSPGTYTVTLTVTTPIGAVASLSRDITLCGVDPVRILETLTGYATLQAAYDDALDTNTIQMPALPLFEILAFNLPKTVTLKGGYNCAFDAIIGTTPIGSLMTITDGTIIADNITVQ